MSAINEERVKNRLDEILKNIQSEADPELLNQYRSLIRKKVSFFQRSYLSAYLLMLQDQTVSRSRDMQRSSPRRSGAGSGAETSRAKSNAARGNEQSEGGEQNRQLLSSATPPALPEDEATRLFISVGRNRRVFPREILGLIGTKTAVSKDDIGTINILNNYSFVQVRSSVAEELITALNGINFRGRTLAVNYARTRKEEDGDIPEKSFEDSPAELPEDATDSDAYSSLDDTSPEEPDPKADPDEVRTE